MLFASQPRDRIAASARRRTRRPQVESLEPRLALSTVAGSLPAGSTYHFGHPDQVAGHLAATRSVAQASHVHQKTPSGHGHARPGHGPSVSFQGRAAARPGLASASSVTTIWATSKDFGGEDLAKAVVIQPNGQIVVAGTAAYGGRGGSGKIALTRYNPDLTPDPSFGVGGTVTSALTAGKENHGRAMVLDATATSNQGKFVVAGGTVLKSGSGDYDFAVARYTSSGTLDTSFGGGKGFASTGVTGHLKQGRYADDEAFAVAIDNTPGANYDKVVAAGFATTNVGSTVALVRYTANGALDTTFNSGGPLPGTLQLPIGGVAVGVAIDSNGNYVVTGSLGLYNGAYDPTSGGTVFLARVTPSGVLDSSFGNGGIIQTSFGYNNDCHLTGLAIDAGNNIVAVGNGDTISGVNSTAFLVARYTPAGVLDPSFGGGAGYIFSDPSVLNNGQRYAHAVAIEPGTGAIYVAGHGIVANAPPGYAPGCFIVARYTSVGTLDMGFNGTGVVSYFFTTGASNDQRANAVALGSNGDVALAGDLQETLHDWGVVHIQP